MSAEWVEIEALWVVAHHEEGDVLRSRPLSFRGLIGRAALSTEVGSRVRLAWAGSAGRFG